MKDFIVLLAVLPLMLLFVMQFACDFRNGQEVAIIQDIVYQAKETAKQEGGFSEQLRASVADSIADRLGIDHSKVTVTAEAFEHAVGRFDADHNIEFRVTVELDRVMAGGKLMGLSDSENRRTFVIDSFTASEYVGGY